MFFYFFCLIALARTSNTISEWWGYHCLILDKGKGGKHSSFSSLHIMLAVSFSQLFFIKWRLFLSIPNLLSFNQEWILDFVLCFCSISWEDNWFFCPCSVSEIIVWKRASSPYWLSLRSSSVMRSSFFSFALLLFRNYNSVI